MSQPTVRQIAVAVETMIENGSSNGLVAKSLAAYLAGERRSKDLEAVMRAFEQMRAQKGYHEVDATTATPIGDGIEKQVKEIIAKFNPGSKKILVHKNLDKSVIGGIKLDSANLSLVATVKGRIKKLTYQGT